MSKIFMKNNKGFTLVEVIVAAAIVAIVSVMLLSGFLAAANLNKKAADAKQNARNIDLDIYANQGSEVNSKEIELSPKQNNLPVKDVDGKTITIPLNIKTFKSGDRQILIFRE